MTSEVFQPPLASNKLWLLTLIIQSGLGAIIETKVTNGKSFATTRSVINMSHVADPKLGPLMY